MIGEFINERRFARSGRTGDADHDSIAGSWIDRFHELRSIGGTAFDDGNCAGHGPWNSVKQFCEIFETRHDLIVWLANKFDLAKGHTVPKQVVNTLFRIFVFKF